MEVCSYYQLKSNTSLLLGSVGKVANVAIVMKQDKGLHDDEVKDGKVPHPNLLER